MKDENLRDVKSDETIIEALQAEMNTNGWISKDQLIEAGNSMAKNQYGQHLLNVALGKIRY